MSGTTRDAFLGGRLMIEQPAKGYRAATDPVLLAAAAPARAGQSVLDLGCGVGTAALCLGARVNGLDLHGLEIQPDYAAHARSNAVANGIGLTVHEGDLGAMPHALRSRVFDLVIANPPYFAAQRSVAPDDPGRALAFREAGRPLSDWIAAGLRRLRPGGRLCLIQRTERLPEMLAALAGAGEIAVLPLAPRTGRPAGRVLLRARKGARGPFLLLAPLVLHEGARHAGDGDDFSAAARAILRDGAAITVFDKFLSNDRFMVDRDLTES